MAQHIDKDALVAKIKERIKTYNKGYANGDDRRADALEVLLHDIDTLEVKEVDLCEEEERIWKDFNIGECHLSKNDLEKIAKHFFELGLKAQRKSISIQNVDDVLKESGIDPDSKVAKMFKESYYAAIDKLLEQKGK